MQRLLPALFVIAGCASTPDDCADAGPGTVCEVAGTGDLAYNGDALPAAETAFYLPSEVRRGPDGLLYVMDFNNMRLRRIEANGTMSTIAGNGFHAGAIEGLLANNSPLENPIDFDWLPDGRVVFLQYHVPSVQVLDTDDTLELFAGTGESGVPGFPNGDGGPAEKAIFVETSGIAVGPTGAVYISDDSGNDVRVIENGTVETLAGTGTAGYTGDGGPATAAMLSGPTALAIDAAGNVYISDRGNCVVRVVSAIDGTISTIAGAGGTGFGGDNGLATNALLDHPDGIAVAADGTLYVGDRENSRVRVVATDGTITTIAGTGTQGWSGDQGPALDAEFSYVSRIQLDTDGGLLIADQTNSRIRKIMPK
jgi:trimeric autotransporter adhesin